MESKINLIGLFFIFALIFSFGVVSAADSICEDSVCKIYEGGIVEWGGRSIELQGVSVESDIVEFCLEIDGEQHCYETEIGSIEVLESGYYFKILDASHDSYLSVYMNFQVECVDTDGGLDYYNLGEITSGVFYFGSDNERVVEGMTAHYDVCARDNNDYYEGDLNTLFEGYCSGYKILNDKYVCPNGCFEGVCVGESDEEDIEGSESNEIFGECTSSDSTDSGEVYVCNSNSYLGEIAHIAEVLEDSVLINQIHAGSPNEGAYLSTGDATYSTIADLENPAKITIGEIEDGYVLLLVEYIEDSSTSETACASNECSLDEKCYSLGYRKDGKFCSEYGFVEQLNVDNPCENDFECSSNLCVDSKCVSFNLWQKIMKWFENIF